MPSRPPVIELPPSSLGPRFWRLASNSGVFTELRDPAAVVRHAIASIRSLQGYGLGGIDERAPLDFVMRLSGDARYASPEQSRGASESSQSLVYSLGVLLFERLTGFHPFGTRSAEERDLCHIPGGLRAILRRALSPFPEDRHRDADALRRALERFLRGDTVECLGSQDTPPPPPGSVNRPLFEEMRAPTDVDEPGLDRAPTEVDVDAFGRGPTVLAPPREPAPGELREHDEKTLCVAPFPQRRLDSLARMALPPAGTGLAVLRRVAPRVKNYGRLPAVGIAAVILVAATLSLAGTDKADSDHRNPTAAAAAPAPIATALPEPEDGAEAEVTVATDDPGASADGHAASDATEVVDAEVIEIGAPPFDAGLAGQKAADAAATCLADGRRARTLPVTLRFDRSGLSDKVFFGATTRLRRAERRCLMNALTGIDAGGSPSSAQLITYTLQLREGAPTYRVAAR